MGSHEPPGRYSVLPRDVPDFVGREPELAVLLAAVHRTTVAAVDGMAGVGKTTLAVHAAHLLAPRYRDGQLYLDLHAHSADYPAVEPAAALETLLRLVGVTGTLPEDLAGRAALWRSTVAGRRLLVVLDNASDSDQVAPLLPDLAGCFALVTSRQRLAGVHGALTVTVDVMPPDDAAALFARSVGDERPTIDPAGAAETVSLCGNLPVAIRIAGARLRHRPTWTVEHLVRRLRDEHRRLAELQAEDRSVSAAFALSYRQLRPDLQRLFRLLGLVPGADLDVPTAAALAGLDPVPAACLLEELLDRHLLVQQVPGRYTFHDLMRQHAREAALTGEPEPDRRAAMTRLFDHYQHTACAAALVLAPHRQRPGDPVGDSPRGTQPAPATPDAALDWLEEERETLLAAVRHAERRGWPGHSWRIACCLAQLCYVRSHRDTWVPSLEIGLRAALRSGDTLGEATVLTALGVAYEHTGNTDAAVDCQRRAVVLYQELGDRAGEATAIKRLGNAHLQLGHIGQALGLYQRAHTFFRNLGDTHGVASSLNNMGVAHQAFGRLSEALEHYQGALVVYQEHGDVHDQGLLMSNIGTIQTLLGRFDEALASHLEALAMARRMGDLWREGTALTCIGTVHRHLGRYEDAVADHLRALELLREVAHPGAQSEVANDLAETYRAAGRPAMAFHHHGEAVRLARQGGERRQEARALDGLAQVHAASGEPDAAADHWRQALAIYAELDLPEAAAVRARLGTASVTHAAQHPGAR
jgi:tetratricopeptide (TPR) repeat protein